MTTGWIFRLRDFEKYENIEVQSPKEDAVIFILPSRKDKSEEEEKGKEEKDSDDENEEEDEQEENRRKGKDNHGNKKAEKLSSPPAGAVTRRRPQQQQQQQQRSSIYQPLKEDVLDESDVMLGTPLIYPSASGDADNAAANGGVNVDAAACPLSPPAVGGGVVGGVAGGGVGGGGRHPRRHPGVAGVGGMARIPLLARAAGGGRFQGYQV